MKTFGPVLIIWVSLNRAKWFTPGLLEVQDLLGGSFTFPSPLNHWASNQKPNQNVYFNDMQIKRWLHLWSGLWGIPFPYSLFRRKVDQKNFLL